VSVCPLYVGGVSSELSISKSNPFTEALPNGRGILFVDDEAGCGPKALHRKFAKLTAL